MTMYTKMALFALFALLAFFSADSMASVGTGGGLPYEGPLTSIRNSFTGPVAFTLSILGLVGAGAALIFGADMNGFLKMIVVVVMVISFLVAANNILATLFGRGALVTAPTASLVINR